MADLKKKTKLLKLLKTLDNTEYPEAGVINDIITELENIKSLIPEKENLSPYFDSVKLLEQEYIDISSSLKELSIYLTNIGVEFDKFTTTTNDKIKGLDKDTRLMLKSFKDEIDQLGLKLLSVMSRGGGSMNQQINVNGVMATSTFADINLIGSITASKNTTTKRTDITFSGSGGLALIKPTSGTVGQNTFMWSVAPSVIVVDGQMMTEINTDDVGVNWTGTTTTILTVAPNYDIFGFA